MIRLDTTTRKLQASTFGNISTAQIPIMVTFSDKTSTTYNGATQLTNTTTTQADGIVIGVPGLLGASSVVDICAAPPTSTIRDIDMIDIRNRDASSVSVTILYNDNGATYELINITLSPSDILTYTHARGWQVNDMNGNLKEIENFPTISNNGILSNISGATASPSANSLSAIIDATLGSVQGDILYRNANLWTVLPPGTANQELLTGGPGANPSWGTSSGHLLNVQVFTATGVYTPTAGTTKIIVEALGAGGGGGGCATTAASQVSAGGGGGAGAFAKALITSGFSGVTVTIGAAGNGGAAGNNTGTSGGSTTFGSVLTAGGGTGGGGEGSNALPAVGGSAGIGGSSSGSSSLFSSAGQNGRIVLNTSTVTAIAGGGGSTLYGSGAQDNVIGSTSMAGQPGTGFGSGGSGAVSVNGNVQQAGGNGRPGLVIIYEYS